MEEKRVHPRIPINIDVSCELKNGAAVTGIGKDLSLGGMFIESEQTPEFGANITIVTRLPGASAESRLPGVVRWAKPGGFGVQFGLLGARETHAITTLLRS